MAESSEVLLSIDGDSGEEEEEEGEEESLTWNPPDANGSETSCSSESDITQQFLNDPLEKDEWFKSIKKSGVNVKNYTEAYIRSVCSTNLQGDEVSSDNCIASPQPSLPTLDLEACSVDQAAEETFINDKIQSEDENQRALTSKANLEKKPSAESSLMITSTSSLVKVKLTDLPKALQCRLLKGANSKKLARGEAPVCALAPISNELGDKIPTVGKEVISKAIRALPISQLSGPKIISAASLHALTSSAAATPTKASMALTSTAPSAVSSTIPPVETLNTPLATSAQPSLPLLYPGEATPSDFLLSSVQTNRNKSSKTTVAAKTTSLNCAKTVAPATTSLNSFEDLEQPELTGVADSNHSSSTPQKQPTLLRKSGSNSSNNDTVPSGLPCSKGIEKEMLHLKRKVELLQGNLAKANGKLAESRKELVKTNKALNSSKMTITRLKEKIKQKNEELLRLNDANRSLKKELNELKPKPPKPVTVFMPSEALESKAALELGNCKNFRDFGEFLTYEAPRGGRPVVIEQTSNPAVPPSVFQSVNPNKRKSPCTPVADANDSLLAKRISKIHSPLVSGSDQIGESTFVFDDVVLDDLASTVSVKPKPTRPLGISPIESDSALSGCDVKGLVESTVRGDGTIVYNLKPIAKAKRQHKSPPKSSIPVHLDDPEFQMIELWSVDEGPEISPPQPR